MSFFANMISCRKRKVDSSWQHSQLTFEGQIPTHDGSLFAKCFFRKMNNGKTFKSGHVCKFDRETCIVQSCDIMTSCGGPPIFRRLRCVTTSQFWSVIGCQALKGPLQQMGLDEKQLHGLPETLAKKKGKRSPKERPDSG